MRQYVNMNENNVRRHGGAKSGQEQRRTGTASTSHQGIQFSNTQQKKVDPAAFYSNK